MLNKCNTGCVFNGLTVNHLMYADDIVIFSPSVSGLQKLLATCETLSKKHDMIFNSKKSACMFFLIKNLTKSKLPEIYLNNEILKMCSSFKYLGHIICHDLSDNTDFERQRRKLYVQGNIILRKYDMCTILVEVKLFKTFCMPLYTTQLWCRYDKVSINKLYTSYHNVLKFFVGCSKVESTSSACAIYDVQG